MSESWLFSATAISNLKACPTRFQLAHVEGLREIETSESRRVGTNWHKCLEIATLMPGEPCPLMGRDIAYMPECPICGTSGIVPDETPIDRVHRWLNYWYGETPHGLSTVNREVERAILAYSVAGWLWYYGENEVETVGREVAFRLPILHPIVQTHLSGHPRVGKIDRLVRSAGRVMLGEYKSTSKPIDSGASYWARLNLDTQISFYLNAARELQVIGKLEQYGLNETDPLISGVLYDVWHRPAIRPKKLTQSDSKAFVETGRYHNQEFMIKNSAGPTCVVDGVVAEIEPGAREGTFTIRETPDMFGARLLHDICANPERHFVRREIARTDDELKDAEFEAYNVYCAMKMFEESGRWWRNADQCEATFRCPYTPICYNRVDVTDGHTPAGFRRIYPVQDKE